MSMLTDADLYRNRAKEQRECLVSQVGECLALKRPEKREAALRDLVASAFVEGQRGFAEIYLGRLEAAQETWSDEQLTITATAMLNLVKEREKARDLARLIRENPAA